jgi:hypothetical protein
LRQRFVLLFPPGAGVLHGNWKWSKWRIGFVGLAPAACAIRSGCVFLREIGESEGKESCRDGFGRTGGIFSSDRNSLIIPSSFFDFFLPACITKGECDATRKMSERNLRNTRSTRPFPCSDPSNRRDSRRLKRVVRVGRDAAAMSGRSANNRGVPDLAERVSRPIRNCKSRTALLGRIG